MSQQNFEFELIYSEGYKNVSGQVLEVENQSVPPNHEWSQLLSQRHLSKNQTDNRGYATQKLIDRGFISKSTIIPVIKKGQMYIQSESGVWWQLEAVERTVDPDDNSTNSLGVRAIKSEPPPVRYVVNFDIVIPYGIYFALQYEQQTLSGSGVWVDQGLGEGIVSVTLSSKGEEFVHEIRRQGKWSLNKPIAFPRESKIQWLDSSGTRLRMYILDSGQLELRNPSSP